MVPINLSPIEFILVWSTLKATSWRKGEGLEFFMWISELLTIEKKTVARKYPVFHLLFHKSRMISKCVYLKHKYMSRM